MTTLCERIAANGPTGVHTRTGHNYYELTPVTIQAKCLSCERYTVLGVFTYCVRASSQDAYSSRHTGVRREAQIGRVVPSAELRLVESDHGTH